jgi:hypothetical protein
MDEQSALAKLTALLAKVADHQAEAPAVLASAGPQMIDLLKGRQKVAINAIKHQVTGHKVFLSEDEFLDYMTIGRELMKELRPRSMRDVQQAQRIIDNNWRCQRIGALENNMLMTGLIKRSHDHVQNDEDSQAIISQTLAYEDDCARSNAFDKLSRHEVRLTRIGMELERQYDRRQRRYSQGLGHRVWVAEDCQAYQWYCLMADLGRDLAIARKELQAARELDQLPAAKPATAAQSSTSEENLFCKTVPAPPPQLSPLATSVLAYAENLGMLKDEEALLFRKLVAA